jgi:hypothetical protein
MDAARECSHTNGYGPPITKSAYSDSFCVRTLEKDKYGGFVVNYYKEYNDIPKSFRKSHNQYCLKNSIKNEFISNSNFLYSFFKYFENIWKSLK